jgi:SAM-dependent methyltransferase
MCAFAFRGDMQQEFAADYADLEDWHWWFRGRQQILEAVLGGALARSSSGPRRLVSVGCGPPGNLSWLLPFAGAGGLVVGLDADPSGALRAAGTGSMPPELGFVIGTLEQPPLRPASCDAVLALDVIEHLDDDVGGLQAAAGLLAPGGVLLVTVPALPSLWGNQDIVSHHRRRYTRRTLLASFQRAGLPEPRVSFFNSLLFPPIAAVRWTRRLRRMFGSTTEEHSDFKGARPGLVNDLLTTLFASERHVVAERSLPISFPIGVSLLALARG